MVLDRVITPYIGGYDSIGSLAFFKVRPVLFVGGDHKPRILRDFSEHGKLEEFCATSGKIVSK